MSDRNRRLAAAAFRAYETLMGGGKIRDMTAWTSSLVKRMTEAETGRILERAAGVRRGGPPKRSKAFQKQIAAEEARCRRESEAAAARAERSSVLEAFEALTGDERKAADDWVRSRIPQKHLTMLEEEPDNQLVKEIIAECRRARIFEYMRRFGPRR